MISRRALIAELAARRVAEWVIVERTHEHGLVDASVPLHRHEQRTRWHVTVHHDVPAGRGTASLELAHDGNARHAIDQAIALASTAIGRAWRATPPAAPARVDLVDDLLERTDLTDTARELLASLPHPAGTHVTAAVELSREHVSVHAHSGFRTSWLATGARGEILVASGERSLAITREARRTVDLALPDAVEAAAADLALLGAAAPPTPGACAVILRADALLHGGGLGVWRVFADQASAELERRGLTRYRVGHPIAPGASEVAEPLSIASDGALDFGLLSAPVSDDGAAIRRFAIVEGGVAVGLGLSMREAARRGTDPNGGVRNLDVARGTWSGDLPDARTLDVRRLGALAIDPYTGDASLEIALAIERKGTTERPVTGGTLRLDLVAALARARRSDRLLRRGAYHGPDAVLLEGAELVA